MTRIRVGDTHGDADGRGGFSQPSAAQGGLATGATPGYRDSPLATVTPGNRPRCPAHVPDVRDSPARQGGRKTKGKAKGRRKEKRGKLGLPGGRRAGVTIDSGTRIGLAVARNGGGGDDDGGGGDGEGAVPTVVPTR